MAVEAREVVYRGRVQGVGFRFTARDIARRFAVAGSVQNQADGGVRLVAQGEPAEVEAFLAAIAERMQENIESVDVQPRSVATLTGFQILR